MRYLRLPCLDHARSRQYQKRLFSRIGSQVQIFAAASGVGSFAIKFALLGRPFTAGQVLAKAQYCRELQGAICVGARPWSIGPAVLNRALRDHERANASSMPTVTRAMPAINIGSSVLALSAIRTRLVGMAACSAGNCLSVIVFSCFGRNSIVWSHLPDAAYLYAPPRRTSLQIRPKEQTISLRLQVTVEGLGIMISHEDYPVALL
jgi:hypothetical protein